jgi:hypothetical protein
MPSASWPQIRDAQGPLASQFNVRSLPAVFVLDHGGVIRTRTSVTNSLDRRADPLFAASTAE